MHKWDVIDLKDGNRVAGMLERDRERATIVPREESPRGDRAAA